MIPDASDVIPDVTDVIPDASDSIFLSISPTVREGSSASLPKTPTKPRFLRPLQTIARILARSRAGRVRIRDHQAGSRYLIAQLIQGLPAHNT
jgi:hypothetical protein